MLMLFCAHSYYITTYPAQLVPPLDYFPTLRSSRDIFPHNMQSDIHNALGRTSFDATSPHYSTHHSSYTTGYNLTSLIPNRVWQTDKRPPLQSDARTWAKNGFERIFLDDDAALGWVMRTFGDSEISRAYKGLPKAILYVPHLHSFYHYLLIKYLLICYSRFFGKNYLNCFREPTFFNP